MCPYILTSAWEALSPSHQGPDVLEDPAAAPESVKSCPKPRGLGVMPCRPLLVPLPYAAVSLTCIAYFHVLQKNGCMSLCTCVIPLLEHLLHFTVIDCCLFLNELVETGTKLSASIWQSTWVTGPPTNVLLRGCCPHWEGVSSDTHLSNV